MRASQIETIVKLIRLEQWTKNVFIYLPLFFGSKLLDTSLLTNVTVAFFGFSFVASSVYIFNDWRDIGADKMHPSKKSRPLASGIISLKRSLIISALCLLAGILLLTFGLQQLNINWVLLLVAVYFIQNVVYSLTLKHIAIVDVLVLAIGFLIRIMIGGAATNIVLSHWIVIMTFLISLFLGLAKRRDDVLLFLKTNEKPRKNIDGYNLDFLNATIIISASIVIVAYIMYTTSLEVTSRINDYVYTTTFFVIVGILRYLQLIYVKEKSGDPTKILLKDKFLQVQIIGWATTFFIMLYARKFH